MTHFASSQAKPVDRLTRSDLSENPIWEWNLDEEGTPGRDESYVYPTMLRTIPKGDFHQYLVSAVAILKDRTELPACMEVTCQGGTFHFNPLFVFLFDRQLDFVGHETDRLLSRYTKRAANRPVRWRLGPLVDGERKVRSGNVQRSFLYLFVSFFLKAAMRKFSTRVKRASDGDLRG